MADGASLARLIAAEEVTVGVGVPTVWLGLVEHLDATGTSLPSLKRIIVGGAPMASGPDGAHRTTPGRDRADQLGHDRAVALRHRGPAERAVEAALSGRPAIGVDLLLTDADGTPLPQQRDVEGHLRVRGAAVIERYSAMTPRRPTPTAGSPPATWRASTPRAT
jgi:acyl-CoA synthetase (AMP-forming)/AMP-acid ligase II